MLRLAMLCLSAGAAASPQAAPPQPPLSVAFRQMYNLDFGGAHDTLVRYMKLHPQDPLAPAADAAATLFSELDRLHILQSEFFLHDENFRTRNRLSPDPAAARGFDRQLALSRQLSGTALERSPRDTNALLALVLAHGLRSDYDALIEKKYLSSLDETKEARRLADRLLATDPGCADAWLAVGVENYLLSLKPLPVRWFLQLHGNQTDKDLGLSKLRITAEKGVYLAPFARLLLAVAALRDHDLATGRRILQSLHAEFPGNHLYQEELDRLREKGF